MRLFAPAKVNLGLSVTARLEGGPQAGYHSLESLFVPLNVGDWLTVTAADTLELQVMGADLPCDSRNLVFRAARAYLDAANLEDNVQRGAKITLTKNLPLASGLGGGSSDAASTLLALTQLYPAGLDLPKLALGLGADVPFFLLGHAAFVSGVGEVLRPVGVPKVHLVLVNVGLEISAKDAYDWLDVDMGFTESLPLERIISALEQNQLERNQLERNQLEQNQLERNQLERNQLEQKEPVPYFNALQEPVLRRVPELKNVLAALEGVGLHSPLMSGSGSTCFALAQDGAGARAAVTRLEGIFPNAWIRVAETL
jgi:4-diphosphocytidyl-2-C-methyl-D-erythritol kinase